MIGSIQVLVSGAGSTLDNLCQYLIGLVEIKRVVADRECAARQIAEKWNLPFVIIQDGNFFDIDVDLHILGGFLSKVVVPKHLEGKIVNIHPALDLKKYGGKGMYGIKVHEAVVQAQEKYTGCTIHVVDNEYDNGRVLARSVVPINESDTPQDVMKKVQAAERLIYPGFIIGHLTNAKSKNN